MLLYEVNLEVPDAINYKVAGWLTEHLQVMLKRRGFQALQWFFRLPHDEHRESEQKTFWTLQYLIEDRDCLDEYLKHEDETNAEIKEKFGPDVVVSRRVLNLLRVAGPAYENFDELKPNSGQ